VKRTQLVFIAGQTMTVVSLAEDGSAGEPLRGELL